MALRKPKVLKYGGATVADPKRLALVARDVITEGSGDQPIVVVVSAMGNMTDELIALARQVHPSGNMARWQRVATAGEDIAAMLLTEAITEQGGRVIDLNTHQINAVAFDDGRLQQIKAVSLIQEHLGQGNIVVVPGYKGVTPNGSTTPLGRGASELLAIALGIPLHLNAEEVMLEKDVDGLSPADPDLVPDTIIFSELDYDQALKVSDDTVVMDRALKLARRWHVPVRVKRSPSIGPSTGGTLMRDASTPEELEPLERNIVVLRAHRACSLVRVVGVRNEKGQAFRLFRALKNICLGNVIQDQGDETIMVWEI